MYLIVILLYLVMPLSLSSPLMGRERPEHIEKLTWNAVYPYLLPDDHPASLILERLFQKGSTLTSCREMRLAGFKNVKPRPFTRVIVAHHPELPNYLIKAYTEQQRPHRKRQSWKIWLSRVYGAELLRGEIERKGWENWFKVPKKWIYPLPVPSSGERAMRKQEFVLLVERLPLATPRENRLLWKGGHYGRARLKALFEMVTKFGLADSAKLENAPFCTDGTIGFIDTETFGEWPVFYHKLSMSLPLRLKGLWLSLIRNKKRIKKDPVAQSLRSLVVGAPIESFTSAYE